MRRSPGCWIAGKYCNVVQNNLCRMTLLVGADFEEEAGDKARAQRYRDRARTLSDNMLKYLVDPEDGSWIWWKECRYPAATEAYERSEK